MIKIKQIHVLVGLLLIFIVNACSVAHKIPAGEQLYNGASFTIKPDSGCSINKFGIRNKLKAIAMPSKNKMVLGMPYKVWWWYKIGEPKRQKGFRYWIRTKFGEAPKLSSDLDSKANCENIEAYLEDLGYYRSKVKGDTTVRGYKVKAKYIVRVAKPYRIDSIQWLIQDTTLARLIQQVVHDNSVLKKGDIITLENIKIERNTIDLNLKEKGYYYFDADYLVANVDTSNQDNTVDIFFALRKDIQPRFLKPQTIHNIVVFPNYTLLMPPPDTSLIGLKETEGIFIRDTVNQFKSSVFTHAISFRKGDLYSLNNQNKTQNRLINLGVFKYVKNRFQPSFDSDTLNALDVYYYLTPQKRKVIQAEIGGFSKSNSYVGGQLNVSWRNRNLLRGAENFSIKTYGTYETSFTDSLRHNNNYRLGAEASLVLPKFFIPFIHHDHNLFPPQTRFLIGYEWMRKQALYTKTFLKFQYELSWKPKINVQHTISPISLSYNYTTAFTPQYLAELAVNPYLSIINRPELISGSFYNFLTQSEFPKAKNVYYFNGNIDIAGNFIGVLNQHKGNAYNHTVFNAYYAQYIKADADFRYSRKISKLVYWANRIVIGVSMPYGNSRNLPFSKQFTIGGANSLRGFKPRNLGPGASIPNNNQILYYPQIGGDYKLEGNSEWRVPVIGKLKAALFADAGNVWVKDSILYTQASKLSPHFLKELAFDSGIGLRYDAGILIIRLDTAIPLRKPWLNENERWVMNQIDFSSSAWRRENIIFNIAIGYPF